MTRMADLDIGGLSLLLGLCLVALLVLLGAPLYALGRDRALRRGGLLLLPLLPALGITLSLMILIGCLRRGLPPERAALWLARLPWGLVPLLLALLMGASLWLLLVLHRRMLHPSVHAMVKEGTDTLPIGLCFAWADGQPLLVNGQMDRLCQQLTGEGLLDASRFWQEVERRGVTDAAGAVALTLEEADWSFTRRPFALDGRKAVQLAAVDMSRLVRMGRTLEENNRELARMNARLKRHGQAVDTLARAEEILAAKMSIHDELGQALLASKYWLTQEGGEPDPAGLMGLWRRNIALLRKEAQPDPAFDPARQLADAAAAVGVRVIQRGPLPQEDPAALRLVFAAARECLTNAVRHAEAETVEMDSTARDGLCTVTLTNDGKPPAGIPAEGGGLGGLRQRIEEAGGTMELTWQPRFRLSITVPVREP